VKFERMTNRWVREGIISSEQAERLIRFEQTSNKARWSRISLYGFVILGSCVMSIGIISLIAANWEDIPEAIKLSAAFLALAVVGTGIYWAQDRDRKIAYDVLSAIFVLWSLATIGLIAQIFHTGGKLYQALLFWLIITAPLAYLGKRMFLSSLWTVGLLFTFFAWILDDDSWWAKHFLGHDEDNLFPIFSITAMWAVCAASISSHFYKLAHFSANLWFWGLAAMSVAIVAGDISFCPSLRPP